MSLTIEKCLQAWTNSLRQMNAKADIVFFGDSLTYYGNFSPLFPGKVVCNLGLRGDTIQGMIDRVELVGILAPSVVFLMAGINDVARNDVQLFEENYNNLINNLSARIPATRIIVQSILPVNDRDFSISCNNKQITNSNSVISRLSAKHGLKYLDLYSEYEWGIYLNNMTKDGIHLQKEGYSMWYDLLKDIVM